MFKELEEGQTHFDPVEEYKARLIEEVEKMKESGPEENCRYDMPHPRAYNKALSDIINLLKE